MIEVRTEGAIATLTLDRESTRNALDWEMLAALESALESLESARHGRVLILRSALDRVFVAGGDISVMRDLNLADGTRFVYTGQRLMRRLEESPLVIIAAVNGYALGGGFELALACDLVVASDSAVFGLPEARIGLLPGWGGTQRLIRAVPVAVARELVYTGRRIDAQEAYRLGVANRVVEPDLLMESARELAQEVIDSSPTAVRHAKRAMSQGARASLDQGLTIEAETWLANLASPNRVEGLSAFLEKRRPDYSQD